MAVIFLLSDQPGAQSYALSAQLAQQIRQDGLAQATPGWFSADFHANLRKWAHIWLYCLLGICTALTVCAFAPAARCGFWRCSLVSAFVCLLYAASDEWHQSFVPGRACLAGDVAVDALGFVPCVLLVCALWRWRAAVRARDSAASNLP